VSEPPNEYLFAGSICGNTFVREEAASTVSPEFALPDRAGPALAAPAKAETIPTRTRTEGATGSRHRTGLLTLTPSSDS
jgi:hypothetical protein